MSLIQYPFLQLWPQFATEDLLKEVENSISEFKRNKQEYDEERVKEQVSSHPP